MPVPDQVETNNFFEAISQPKQKPAILSVVHPFNQSFKPKTKGVKATSPIAVSVSGRDYWTRS